MKSIKETTYKVGDELWHVGVCDDGTCTCDLWVVRTIRGGKITAIERNEFTWVRNPDKFGGPRVWDKNIHPSWRRSWKWHQPTDLFKLKSDAWKHAMTVADMWDADDPVEGPIRTKILMTCKRKLTECERTEAVAKIEKKAVCGT